ncbi:MAG: 3-dehydroquinate synthase [Acidobacteriota bacterium]|nr:3-dehydroquinate synthase [Acidobacteriota bacterium]
MKNISVNLNKTSHSYEIKIGHRLLNSCGDWAATSLSGKINKIALISNAEVFRLYGETVKNSLENKGFEVFVWKIGDGERYKNFRVLENTLRFFSEKKLKRSDAVIAVGGGVIGDLAGFAAAIYLRGIPFLQIPTTLLAMIDSSVGGKTAVNTEFGKNLIGAFYQPSGVLVDFETLRTLPRREITAGFCEAVKQGAVANRQLFDQTHNFLRNYSPNKFKRYFSDKTFLENLQRLLATQIAFKANIVMQDEYESAARDDAKSRKILNFGHTVGHALEKATNFKTFKHGEAVGYGILAAGEIAKNVGIFAKDELDLLNDVVGLVGKLPTARNINIEEIIKAFEFDKKSTGNTLKWVLLEKIGKPKIVESTNIPAKTLQKSLATVLKKS